MTGNSTRKRRRRKRLDRPGKPYKDFPLYAHPTGNWAKKIHGKFYYFGRWGQRQNGKMERLPDDGWQKALENYKAQADDLNAGRSPRRRLDGITMAELCNRFLTAKLRKMEAGELSPRSFAEYRQATDLMIDKFSKRLPVEELVAEDFESLRDDMAKRWGLARRSKFIQLVRSIFRYAEKNGLVQSPTKFGSEFHKPDKAVMRRHREASGKKLFTAREIRAIVDALDGKQVTARNKSGESTTVELKPNYSLKAAVLLGINAGLGNSDISGLQFSNIEFASGWMDFPRVKTGIRRRCPLWKETLDALKIAIAKRRTPNSDSDAGCVFVNRAGRRMVQMTERSHQDYVSSQFRAVLRALGINGRRGLNFYALRHSFASIGLQRGDRDAVRYLMGHATHDVLNAYDETGPDNDRLLAVVQHVYNWLFEAERRVEQGMGDAKSKAKSKMRTNHLQEYNRVLDRAP